MTIEIKLPEVKTEEKVENTQLVQPEVMPEVKPETPVKPPVAEVKTVFAPSSENPDMLPAKSFKAQRNLKVGGVLYKKDEPVLIADADLLKSLLEKGYVL